MRRRHNHRRHNKTRFVIVVTHRNEIALLAPRRGSGAWGFLHTTGYPRADSRERAQKHVQLMLGLCCRPERFEEVYDGSRGHICPTKVFWVELAEDEKRRLLADPVFSFQLRFVPKEQVDNPNFPLDEESREMIYQTSH